MTTTHNIITEAIGLAEGGNDPAIDRATADAVLKALAAAGYEVRYAGYYVLRPNGDHLVATCPCPSCTAYRKETRTTAEILAGLKARGIEPTMTGDEVLELTCGVGDNVIAGGATSARAHEILGSLHQEEAQRRFEEDK